MTAKSENYGSRGASGEEPRQKPKTGSPSIIITINGLSYYDALPKPVTGATTTCSFLVEDPEGDVQVVYGVYDGESLMYREVETCSQEETIGSWYCVKNTTGRVVGLWNNQGPSFWANNSFSPYTVAEFDSTPALISLQMMRARYATLNGSHGEVTEDGWVFHSCDLPWANANYVVCSSLNGSCGEATNEDDRPKKTNNRKEMERRQAQSLADKKGKGSYKDMIKAGNILAAFMGPEAAAAMAGVETAAKVGNLLSKGMGKPKRAKGRGDYTFTGSGSYETVTNNTISGVDSGDGLPRFGSNGDTKGDMVIAYDEYVTKLYSPPTNSFYNTVYSINPGLPAMFPWLSQVASNYTLYEFTGLIATFVPNTGLITTGSMGFVTMVFDYNPSDTGVFSESTTKNMAGSVTGTPVMKIICGAECDKSKTLGLSGRYIRSGAIPDNTDIKTYDLANLNISMYGINTAAFPAGTVIGELHIAYKVKLVKPKVYDSIGYNIPLDVFASGGTITSVVPMGDAYRKGANNSIGGTINRTSPQVYTFPDAFEGQVMVVFYVNKTAASPGTPSLSWGGNVANTWNYISNATPVGNALWAQTFYSGASDSTNIVTASFKLSKANTANGNYLTVITTQNPTSSGLMVFAVNPNLPAYPSGYVTA